MAENEKDYEGMDTGRILSLSDAIFGFSITLLALNIAIPAGTTHDNLVQALFSLEPQILHYAISFLVIGSYWIAHHRIFKQIRRYDHMLIWLNLFFLMTITFIPFLTDFMSDYLGPVSTAIYAASLGTSSLLLSIIWLHAIRGRRLVDKKMTDKALKHGILRGVIVAGVFYLSIPVALESVFAAQMMWILLLALMPLFSYLYLRRGK